MYKLIKLAGFSLLLGLSLLFAQSGSVSGKWKGSIIIDDSGSGTKIETPVELDLEQKGDALSGKIGRAGEQERVEIRNGKFEGGTVTFEASSVEASSAMKFSLTVKGEEMTGEMKGAAEGNNIVAKVTFTRAK
jgi:hypothetical protein